MSIKLVLVAACALVDTDGRVLLAERPAGKSMAGLWEFPGGKIEAGERPEETIEPDTCTKVVVVRRLHVACHEHDWRGASGTRDLAQLSDQILQPERIECRSDEDRKSTRLNSSH